MTTATPAPPEVRLIVLEQVVSRLAGMVDALVRVSPLPPPVWPTANDCPSTPELHDPLTDTKPLGRTPPTIPWPEQRTEEAPKAKFLQDEGSETERYAALGRLFLGVSHDVNNLLTVICGYAELLAEGLPSTDSRHETATTVAQLGHQAADLIRYLNDLGTGVSDTSPAHINELLRRISRLLPRYVGSDVHFSLQLGTDAGSIYLAPAELLQLVLKLVGNARDATPPQGTVSLRTAAHHFTTDRPGWPDIVPAGKYAVLAITDTGRGMEDATRMRMFDEGFTTRRGDGGYGIGLSTVRAMVARVNGYIQVQSVIDWGTTVRLFFPAI